jgi:hypothetical protein
MSEFFGAMDARPLSQCIQHFASIPNLLEWGSFLFLKKNRTHRAQQKSWQTVKNEFLDFRYIKATDHFRTRRQNIPIESAVYIVVLWDALVKWNRWMTHFPRLYRCLKVLIGGNLSFSDHGFIASQIENSACHGRLCSKKSTPLLPTTLGRDNWRLTLYTQFPMVNKSRYHAKWLR